MEQSRLKRDLGLIHVLCIATGAMISSGIFVLPGPAYGKAGPAIVIGYLLAGVLSLPGMLSLAEMATAMPRAGADCYTVIRSMGPGVGAVAGLLSWFALAMKAAFALIGTGVFVATVANVDIRITGIACCLVFVALNVVGVKEAGRTQIILASGLLALMLLYVLMGLPSVSVQRFEPFARGGWGGLFFVTGYVFISYAGLLKIGSVAEEIRNPSRNIPLGMIMSLLLVTLLYSLMVFVTVGVLDGAVLGGDPSVPGAGPSLTPISDGAGVFMGRPGRVALSIAAILAFLTTANAGIMTAARSLVPLSRDHLFPGAFGRIHSRFGTPHNALLLTGAVIIAALFVKLDVLVEAGSIVLILTNMLTCLSVIILRESGLQNYRPQFRTPFYPWLQVAGLVAYGGLLLGMGRESYLITVALAGAGVAVYWLYGRKRVRLESALLHLVARITDRVLVTGTLERELREIIRERDQIVADRFDEMVERAAVLDIEEAMDLESFFKLAAEKMAERVGMSPARLAALLMAREQESGTVIAPGLAIPHVVIEGEKIFDMLLARSRGGITFSSGGPKVHAVFVLVGTRDERNFHLRALAAIAQIVQDPAFEKRWMAARNEQALRDVIILGQRRRGE